MFVDVVGFWTVRDERFASRVAEIVHERPSLFGVIPLSLFLGPQLATQCL